MGRGMLLTGGAGKGTKGPQVEEPKPLLQPADRPDVWEGTAVCGGRGTLTRKSW